MAGKNTAVFGIYQTQADVEYAVDALRSEGFRNTDVSVLFPDNKGTKDFAVDLRFLVRRTVDSCPDARMIEAVAVRQARICCE